MTYIPDLTFCRYSRVLYGPTLAVGWLDPTESFPTGKVSSDFLKKLKSYLIDTEGNVINFMRGTHRNELPENTQLKQGYEEELGPIDRLGRDNGEIHFVYQNIFYAAPAMIYEYIVRNGYLPPEEYIEAVMKGKVINRDNIDNFIMINPEYDTFELKKEDVMANLLRDAMAILEPRNFDWWIRKIFNKPKIYDGGLETIFLALYQEMKHGSPQKMLDATNLVLSHSPGFGLFHIFKAIAMKDLGQIKAAEKYFIALLPEFRHKDGKNCVEILFNLAKIAESKGDMKGAKSYYQEAHSLNPDDTEIKANLNRFKRIK